MELIDQHSKRIMEGCKERAREAGLSFEDETLEYIVTNRDLLELSPKLMIPTLYDYWVHDVEVLKEKGRYELYPGNPYETVINTRPAISFYNDNNPDWLNVMIFYHVLAHIDFMQTNLFFRPTWDLDFTGQALSDKRLIAKLRSEKGRWVDYVIEFARGIDNLVGFFGQLGEADASGPRPFSRRVDYYFDVFLQSFKKVRPHEYIKEVDRYNDFQQKYGDLGEQTFFAEVSRDHPEFDAMYRKYRKEKKAPREDILQFLMNRSEFLNKYGNRWMKSVVEVIRKTSLFFQPQIRTKIMNEGWASFWHETLFLSDDRISGHEADFARVNAGVTAMPRVGLNPYALGMRLFYHIEEMAAKGKYTVDFERIRDTRARRDFDAHTGGGREYIFRLREGLTDFLFIRNFVDQDFVDRHRLFVAGKRLNESRMVWEYYVKSRKAEDYRQMLLDALYHPPRITVDEEKGNGALYLVHQFEGKPLVSEYIANTLLGMEFLWGAPVKLETSEVESVTPPRGDKKRPDPDQPPEIKWRRVVYTMENRKLSKEVMK